MLELALLSHPLSSLASFIQPLLNLLTVAAAPDSVQILSLPLVAMAGHLAAPKAARSAGELMRALGYLRSGMPEEAALVCQAVLANSPRHPDALRLLAMIRLEQRNFPEAERLIGRALRDQPVNAEALYLYGNILAAQHRWAEAAERYLRAIAIAPENPDAHNHRGNALRQLGRMEEALACYETALALAPGHANAAVNRYTALLNADADPGTTLEAGMAAAHAHLAARASALRAEPPASISRFRLQHDFEQSAWLLAQPPRDDFAALQAAHAALCGPVARADAAENAEAAGPIRLLPQEAGPVADYQCALALPVLAPVPEVLNADIDWRALEDAYLDARLELAVVDNFLTPAALAAFRDFCLRATIWKHEYANAYLGAYFDWGFVSALHLQVARELKTRMPRVFGPWPLEEMWAFKCDPSVTRGIGVHADYARVNVNFWVTPDAANLDPVSGGLVVYDQPAPASWAPLAYNRDAGHIRAYLAETGASCVRVPYRCNRALIFNPTLFHETDTVRFRPGYENRRINITYLFGRTLQTEF